MISTEVHVVFQNVYQYLSRLMDFTVAMNEIAIHSVVD